MLKAIPKEYFDPAKGTLKLLWEEEWRGLGITQVNIGATSMASKTWLTSIFIAPGLGALRGS